MRCAVVNQVVLAAGLAAGCNDGGSRRDAPVPSGAETVRSLEALRDRACACTDAGCVRTLEGEFAAWYQAHGKAQGTAEQGTAIAKVAADLERCLGRDAASAE